MMDAMSRQPQFGRAAADRWGNGERFSKMEQYVALGYWFYVSGIVPEAKDWKAVAEKLIAKYGISVSKFVSARRKLSGHARMLVFGKPGRRILAAWFTRKAVFGKPEEPCICVSSGKRGQRWAL